MLRLFHKLKNKPVLARWLFYLCLTIALVPIIFSKDQHIIGLNITDDQLFGHEKWLSVLNKFNVFSAEQLLITLSVGLSGFAAELRCRQKGISAVNALLIIPVVVGQLIFLGHVTAVLAIAVALIGFIILDYRLPKWLYFFFPLLFGWVIFAINPPILPAFITLIIIDFIIVRKEEKRLAIVGSTLALLSFLLLQDVFLPSISPGFSTAPIQNITNQPQRWFQFAWATAMTLLILTEITRAKRWTYSGRSFALAGLSFLFLAILFQNSAPFAKVWWYIGILSICFLMLSEIRKVWQRILIIALTAIWLPLFVANTFSRDKGLNTIEAQQSHKKFIPLTKHQQHFQ